MPPPTSKAVIEANGRLMDGYLKNYFKLYIPNEYTYKETSGYRSPAVNAKTPGAAKDSAHMYNLARDWILVYQSDGTMVPEAEAKEVFEISKDNWDGYIYFDKSTSKKSYHIHGNLDRSLTKYSKTLTTALVIFGLGLAAKPFLKKLLARRKPH